jgi:fido (protein-threonine AMPylation protein)
MTMNVPLIGKCPKWEKDIPADRAAEFILLVTSVHQEILTSASHSLVDYNDVRRWHAHLFRDFVPLDYYAGNWRGIDKLRPCLQENVSVGGISGSDFRFVQRHMFGLFHVVRLQLSQLELNWAQLQPSQRALRLAITAANFIGGFVQIHPFLNGNGRTSRLLWRWCLLRFGVPVQCCVYPRPKHPYGDLMRDAMRGDYRPLTIYILDHLANNPPAQN